MNNTVKIRHGWSLEQSTLVAKLYHDAFAQKLSAIVPCQAKRLILLEKCFNPQCSFVALLDNKIIGIAGFQLKDGSLTSGLTGTLLINELGLLKGLKPVCFLVCLNETLTTKSL